MNWIKVENELPPNGEEVIGVILPVHARYQEVHKVKYDAITEQFIAIGGWLASEKDTPVFYAEVTHWMPLPELPPLD